jgi:transposase
MAKPRSRPQLSFDTAYLYDDAAGIAEDHWSRRFFEHVYCAFDDADFAELYEDGGRYPVSPSLLSGILLLQYMFRVSDRVAVENTIMRRDWRIALGIGREYAGFDPSVLCRFRQRLVAHGRERELFDRVLGKLGELGLLAGRRKLRVDATHVVADVTRLSRAELIREAMRVVVCAASQRYPELRVQADFQRLYETYGEEVWVGGGSGRKVSDEELAELGRDAVLLLRLVGAREVKGGAILAQVLEENFEVEGGEDHPPPRDGDKRPRDRIATPHDPDARYGKQRNHKWVGDKAHFVETADRGRTNFLIDVMVTDPRIADSTVLLKLAWRSRLAVLEADTLLADTGYASAANSRQTAEMGLDLITPPRFSNRFGKIPLSEFRLDFERQVATCPEGHESLWWRERDRDLQIRFDMKVCAACPRRAECTDSTRGRTLAPSREYQQLLRDRARAETDEWKALYRRRAGIEATISELVHCCDLRRSRYRGAPFRALHVFLSAAALNVRRMLRATLEQRAGCSGSASAPTALSAVALAVLWLAKALEPALTALVGLGHRRPRHGPMAVPNPSAA